MKQEKFIRCLPLLGALAFFLLGLSLFLFPEPIIRVLPVLIGLVLILVGIQGIAYTAVMHSKMMNAGFKLMHSFINLLIGLVFLLKQDVSLVFLSVLFGLYILFSAVVNFTQTVQNKSDKHSFAIDIIEILLSCIFGFLLLFSPFSGLSLWVRVLGIYFIIAGIGLFRWWYTARKENS